MTKEEILAEASRIISKDRNLSHGDAFQNHAEIAEFWNIFLDDKLKPSTAITSDEVATMMALLKISRSQRGRANVDDYVDASAYMAIAGELKHDN